jgi:hypothetical protein
MESWREEMSVKADAMYKLEVDPNVAPVKISCCCLKKLFLLS